MRDSNKLSLSTLDYKYGDIFLPERQPPKSPGGGLKNRFLHFSPIFFNVSLRKQAESEQETSIFP